jgi:hypothetical protein
MSARRLATLLALVAAPVAFACAIGGRAQQEGALDRELRIGLPTAADSPSVARERRFPHAAHAGLFPTCVGCHEGVVTGAAAKRFPEPASCNGCHDGSPVPRVEWAGPTPAPSNLRFSHVEHAREVQADSQRAGAGAVDSAFQCQACHGQEGDVRFLAVARARPARCLECHAHEAPAHLDPRADCRTCHVPLVQATALSAQRIADFPRPPSHDAPDFLLNHAPGDERAVASCATCHAQESCARCHVNARTEPRIAALQGDARVARLVSGRAGEWPEPPSHRDRDWAWAHGDDAARDTKSCATCHAQPSCRACHIGTGADEVIRRLPAPGRGEPQGVRLERATSMSSFSAAGQRVRSTDAIASPTGRHYEGDVIMEPSAAAVLAGDASSGARADTVPRRHVVRVHAADYARVHGTEASARQMDCTSCHVQKFCSDCHAGEGRRRFHPANFVQRHAPEAWGREQDCASCHNTEAFCRSCHASAGLVSSGGLSSAYHTRQPGWLLQHGQAARQGLESCTTCHVQRDCMQCHSRAGWNVSPHGPGFDAERMQRRAPGTCAMCHVGNPLASPRRASP